MPLDSRPPRPLLPLTTQQSLQESNPTDGDDGSLTGRKRRCPYTSKACNFCRDKKKACDGQPECSQCLRRGLKCEYRVLTDTILKAIPTGFQLVDKEESLSNADAADLLEILKGLPEDEALEGLQLLRTGNDPALICFALRGNDAGLSSAVLNRASLPPKQSSLEFELMMRHPVAYPTWPPPRPSKADLEFLLLPREALWRRTGSTGNADSLSQYVHRQEGETCSSASLVGPRKQSTLYDNRLLSIDITQWTDVPVTNEFSIAVLQLYLETDHPMMPLIDDDLLLDGLLGKNEFCSRILVSGLFAWACVSGLNTDYALLELPDVWSHRYMQQGYATFEPEATIVGHSFYEEAKTLWMSTKEAGARHGICTAAAVHFLLMTSVSLGAGAQYVEFLHDLLDMSRRLELFNIDPSHDARLDLDKDATYRKAKSQLAWVLFACLTEVVLSMSDNQVLGMEARGFMDCLMVTRIHKLMMLGKSFFSIQLHQRLIEHPPRAALPGDNIQVAKDAGIIQKERRRIDNAILLREHCRLFLIVHDIVGSMYRLKQTSRANAATLAFAEETYRRLLTWADNLPLGLAQGDQCTHYAVVLHIYHHLAIMDLFRPLLQHNGAPRQRLSTFQSEESTPDAVYAASVRQLKRIVVSYRHNYPESSYSFFWHSALLYLANATLAEVRVAGHTPDWRFYLRLCMACYQTLYTGFRLAKGITLSLLHMALEKGAMDIPQARAIRKDLESRRKHHAIPDGVPVYWVVDLDLAVTDPSAAQVENLVQKLRERQLGETSETT